MPTNYHLFERTFDKVYINTEPKKNQPLTKVGNKPFVKPFSVDPIKWSNTLKQFVGNSRGII